MRRRQFLQSAASVPVVTAPLAGCAAPTTSNPTPLSDPDEGEIRGGPALVYSRDDDRLVEFRVDPFEDADDESDSDVAAFDVYARRGERVTFDSVRYAFTTSSPGMHPVVYVRRHTVGFPPFTFAESGQRNATVVLVDEFDEFEFSQLPMHFLLYDDELPTELTVAARIVVTERDGGRRYVAEPTVTVELTES
ncbi:MULTISPECIES: hypothetical protein [Haloferax]|uniref:DUF8121 domain-containing protein n=1 Tax=Haloferax marinum TaxID=2666143 RepID=A0A6A8G7R6_9EURY|nr:MULTISPECIES: hypothetical protein [Haloferax]KAB1197283.1 hypothetical protein Hfx1150_07060 [Haloferax sp. CBA1150]MRW96323.1 hypothetical protein [Haloferax marinum]